MTINVNPKTLKIELLELIKQAEKGIGVHQLLYSLKDNPSKRNVQRLLTELVEEKAIYRLGKGPATVYQAPYSSRLSQAADKLSFSDTSKNIINQVSQPLSARLPVTYHREMLDVYKPNKTEYLDQSTRAILHQIGKTSGQMLPAGTFAHEILNRLLIDLSWASSKLEGNTYTRLDTQRLIEYGESVEGKDLIETQMILNHKDAIRFLVEDIEQIDIKKPTLLNLHGLLSFNLLPNPEDCGRIRSKIVDISGTAYKPIAIPQIIDECFDVLLEKASQIKDPFEQSFFLMVHIPYLQPFMDVNKRVSRLSANIPLLKNNLCPLTFIGMPEQSYIQGTLGIYELNEISLLKEVYVMAYERSAQEYLAVHQSFVPPDPLKFKYRTQMRELVNMIVKTGNENPHQKIQDYAKSQIALADQSLFIKFVVEELNRLHEGLLAVYKLNTADFEKWKKMQR